MQAPSRSLSPAAGLKQYLILVEDEEVQEEEDLVTDLFRTQDAGSKSDSSSSSESESSEKKKKKKKKGAKNKKGKNSANKKKKKKGKKGRKGEDEKTDEETKSKREAILHMGRAPHPLHQLRLRPEC